MENRIKVFVYLSGAIYIILSAFGAHSLVCWFTPYQMEVFQKAASYQIIHTLALWILSLEYSKNTSKWLNYSAICFVTGILIFSGSLYLLSLTSIGKLGMLTPIGGILLILGWMCAIPSLFKKN